MLLEEPSVVLPRIPGVRVVRTLGRGGMGAVFLVVDDETHHTAALKVIAPCGPTGDPAARLRFDREIAAVSAIRHRNVVRLLRAGEVDGVPYALFERVRGRTLPRIGAQSWQVVVDLGRQLARALAAVHAAGWLHRDLKPSNAMVGDHGLLTLIDFGLARHVTDPDSRSSSPSPHDAALTSQGNVVGTMRYLAPEIRRGQPATAASDVYALALTMHHLLGGQVNDAGRRTAHDQAVPRELQRLFDSMFAEERWRRPTSAVVAAALDAMPSRRIQFRSSARDDVPTWPVAADGRPTLEHG